MGLITRPDHSAAALLAELGTTGTGAVPVDDIAAALGVRVARARAAASEYAFVMAGPPPIIGVNDRWPAARQRVALAHALGHHRLHRRAVLVDSAARQHDDHDRPQSSPTPAEEQQANTFALELLLPADAVRAAARLYAADDPGRAQLLAELARHFDVTRDAVVCRVVELGLVAL